MICHVSYSIKGQRGHMTVIAKSTIDALLIVMQRLNLNNGIVKVLTQ